MLPQKEIHPISGLKKSKKSRLPASVNNSLHLGFTKSARTLLSIWIKFILDDVMGILPKIYSTYYLFLEIIYIQLLFRPQLVATCSMDYHTFHSLQYTRISHCYFIRLNPRKKGTFKFCHQALLESHRNSKQKEFFRSSEGFLR